MQIRRYTGVDLPDVLDRVHRELGPNAAILNTRRISEGGFFGLLGKPAYEVTVAVDYDTRIPGDEANGHHEAAPAPQPPARITGRGPLPPSAAARGRVTGALP